MTLEMSFNIIMTIAASALGLLIKNLYAQIDANKHSIAKLHAEMQEQVVKIQLEYVHKSDARHDESKLLSELKDINRKMDNLAEKVSAVAR